MRTIVIGAGIAGLATAWALVKRGHGVTLVEQSTIPNPLGASGDHHRIIRRAYGPGSGYGRAITEAYEAWEELWADFGRRHDDPRGFMCLSRAPGDDAETYLEAMQAGGWAFERFDGREAGRRYPFLDGETIRFGFVSPEGGALHCRRIGDGLVEWLRDAGALLRPKTRALAVDAAAGVVRLETGEEIAAERVIVTAGAWVVKLFPDLAADLAPMRTAVVYLEPPDDLAEAWAGAPVILDVGGRTDGYVVPPSGGAGLKFGSGLHRRSAPDPGSDRRLVPGEGEAIRDLFAPPMARIGEYRVAEAASCVYTFTEDETFFCAERGRALVVSACSGHGYKFGAAIGRRVAAWAEDGDTAALRRWLRAEAA